jgi:hypothetical protein
MPPQYKFVEVAPVSEATLEAAVNEWVGRGWQLDGIRFVTAEGAPRPQLAYVSFVTHPAPETGPEPRPEPQPAPPPGAGPAPPPGPLPIDPAKQPPRVITAPGGDEVE